MFENSGPLAVKEKACNLRAEEANEHDLLYPVPVMECIALFLSRAVAAMEASGFRFACLPEKTDAARNA